MTEIQSILFAHRDPSYAVFLAKLIPTLPKETIIGVRSPEYRKIKKELSGIVVPDDFLKTLPHVFYEENIIHNILLADIRDFDECLEKVEQFLPFVDNWAVCDGLNPPALGTRIDALKVKIPLWIGSNAPYTKRFGMRMLMNYFLDEYFDPEMLKQPAAIRSDEYYVNMMTAWLFAEALVRQWDSTARFLEERQLDKWTHNKTIQKAVESFRITDEQKDYLKTLRIKR